jgi:hypothetical protein
VRGPQHADVPGHGDNGRETQDAVFRILDRAQMGFDLKRAAFDAISEFDPKSIGPRPLEPLAPCRNEGTCNDRES